MQPRHLTIFEGPDGSGKTTAAKNFAEETNAVYVHFGPLFNVTTGIARMYVEAMLPALLGYQDVVFDRSWLSETPYGNAFRNGQDRMGHVGRRMLERLAMRCYTTVVRCDPGWLAVKTSYETGRDEMLTDTAQLRLVYDAYRHMETALPVTTFDWVRHELPLMLMAGHRTQAHRIWSRGAGNLRAKVLLVGESFAEHKNDDPWYQWPFASFSKAGCSWWLTEQLAEHGISEADLRWINADEPDLGYMLRGMGSDVQIVAMGKVAGEALQRQGYDCYETYHPQFLRRFGNEDQRNVFFNFIQECINDVKQTKKAVS